MESPSLRLELKTSSSAKKSVDNKIPLTFEQWRTFYRYSKLAFHCDLEELMEAINSQDIMLVPRYKNFMVNL
jgi:hypothetical protein